MSTNQPKSASTVFTAASLESRNDCSTRKYLAGKAVAEECLKAHNFYRRRHNVPDLELDMALCQVAQMIAAKLAQSGDVHQYSGLGCGENIFFSTPGTAGGKEACEAWYNESRIFDWKYIDEQKGTQHFTQMIWKGTKKLGVAVVTTIGGSYLVAEYSPPGNVIGQYRSNIYPPSDKNKLGNVHCQ